MTRILNLQAMASSVPVDLDNMDSTSSGSSCACSTHSAAVCFIGDDVIAI